MIVELKNTDGGKAQESQALQWQKVKMSDLAPECIGKRERMNDGIGEPLHSGHE
jgi:hypothetical protein